MNCFVPILLSSGMYGNNLIAFNGPKMDHFYLPSSECALEYTGPVNELKDMCEIRIEVAGILRDCRVSYAVGLIFYGFNQLMNSCRKLGEHEKSL